MNSSIQDNIDRNRSRVHYFGALVITGLVVEVFLALVFRKADVSLIEAWSPVVADFLVALGVIGEIYFGNEVSKDEERLQLEAQRQIAEANLQAAEARERTAKLEAESAWRRISQDQQAKIAQAIREVAPSLDLVIEFQNGDVEAFSYASDIASVFKAACTPRINGGGNIFMSGMVFGLHLVVASDIDASIIVTALDSCGLRSPQVSNQFDLASLIPRFGGKPNVYVFVGAKVPESMITWTTDSQSA